MGSAHGQPRSRLEPRGHRPGQGDCGCRGYGGHGHQLLDRQRQPHPGAVRLRSQGVRLRALHSGVDAPGRDEP
uniref:Uncharacterized protein n=1 Tax=uncultured marine virus TaxID=186617 RepID=A0A0F7L5H9_9VIRU|nr:hypothetical protein [uncultured marine virus]